MKTPTRITEAIYLAAVDVVRQYRKQIEDETFELVVVPKKGDLIKLTDVPRKRTSLKNGQVCLVHSVWKEKDVYYIFLDVGKGANRPRISTKDTKFEIILGWLLPYFLLF